MVYVCGYCLNMHGLTVQANCETVPLQIRIQDNVINTTKAGVNMGYLSRSSFQHITMRNNAGVLPVMFAVIGYSLLSPELPTKNITVINNNCSGVLFDQAKTNFDDQVRMAIVVPLKLVCNLWYMHPHGDKAVNISNCNTHVMCRLAQSPCLVLQSCSSVKLKYNESTLADRMLVYACESHKHGLLKKLLL